MHPKPAKHPSWIILYRTMRCCVCLTEVSGSPGSDLPSYTLDHTIGGLACEGECARRAEDAWYDGHRDLRETGSTRPARRSRRQAREYLEARWPPLPEAPAPSSEPGAPPPPSWPELRAWLTGRFELFIADVAEVKVLPPDIRTIGRVLREEGFTQGPQVKRPDGSRSRRWTRPFDAEVWRAERAPVRERASVAVSPELAAWVGDRTAANATEACNAIGLSPHRFAGQVGKQLQALGFTRAGRGWVRS